MWWVSLLLVVGLGALYMILHQPDRRGMPPGPKGLPLVGNLFDLLWEDSVTFFSRLAEEHGPLYSVQLGLRRVVVINSSHWLTQAFVRQGDMFNHRPRGTVFNFIMGGKGIIDAEGPVWRDSRRFTARVLRDLGLATKNIETFVNYELQEFLDTCQEQVGRPYNLHHDLATSVLNVLWHMMVGERYAMGDPHLLWAINSLAMALTLVEQGGFLNYTPVIQFVGTFLKPKALKVGLNMSQRLKHYRSVINQHKATLDDPARGNDYIYEYLMESRRQAQREDDLTFTDQQLLWLLSDLFIVGLDTTVTTLRWCFLFLLRHPHLQDALFHEIEANIGTERLPTYEDRLKMPYTEAFLTEVFRYGSILPLVVHSNPEETTLGGYRVPERTWVIGNIRGVHWNKQVWIDPENFRPERFLNKDGQLLRSDNVVVFSVGKRNCLGESVARIEAFQFLTGFLQRYRLSVPPGQEAPSAHYVLGITLNPPEFPVLISNRSATLAH
ncbi:cytochrome P450 2U1-like [Procambarus clarkii]|uniref:cytochrome P450 2U1-like n=1 Tax=Procambarus clarkii TaxID=6728 RepID=UPI00374227C1